MDFIYSDLLSLDKAVSVTSAQSVRGRKLTCWTNRISLTDYPESFNLEFASGEIAVFDFVSSNSGGDNSLIYQSDGSLYRLTIEFSEGNVASVLIEQYVAQSGVSPNIVAAHYDAIYSSSSFNEGDIALISEESAFLYDSSITPGDKSIRVVFDSLPRACLTDELSAYLYSRMGVLEDFEIKGHRFDGRWRITLISSTDYDSASRQGDSVRLTLIYKKGYAQSIDYDEAQLVNKDDYKLGSSVLVLKFANMDASTLEEAKNECSDLLSSTTTLTDPYFGGNVYEGTWRLIKMQSSENKEDGSGEIVWILVKPGNQEYYARYHSDVNTVTGNYFKWDATSDIVQELETSIYFKSDGSVDTQEHPESANPRVSWNLRESVAGRTVQKRTFARDPEDRLFDVEIEITWTASYKLSTAVDFINYQRDAAADVRVDQGYGLPDSMLCALQSEYSNLADNKQCTFQFQKKDGGVFDYIATITTINCRAGFLDTGSAWFLYGSGAISTSDIPVPTALDGSGEIQWSDLKDALSLYRVQASVNPANDGTFSYNIQVIKSGVTSTSAPEVNFAIEQRWMEQGSGTVLPTDIHSYYDTMFGQWYALVDFSFEKSGAVYSWTKKTTRYQIKPFHRYFYSLDAVVSGSPSVVCDTYGETGTFYANGEYGGEGGGGIGINSFFRGPTVGSGEHVEFTIDLAMVEDTLCLRLSLATTNDAPIKYWYAPFTGDSNTVTGFINQSTGAGVPSLQVTLGEPEGVEYSLQYVPAGFQTKWKKEDVTKSLSFQPVGRKTRGAWKEEVVPWQDSWNDYSGGSTPPPTWKSQGYQAKYGDWKPWYTASYIAGQGIETYGDDFGAFIGRDSNNTGVYRYSADYFGQKAINFWYKSNESGSPGTYGTDEHGGYVGITVHLYKDAVLSARDLDSTYTAKIAGFSVYNREVLKLRCFAQKEEFIRWHPSWGAGTSTQSTPSNWVSAGYADRYGDWNSAAWIKATVTSGDNAGDFVGISGASSQRYQPAPQSDGLYLYYMSNQSGSPGAYGTDEYHGTVNYINHTYTNQVLNSRDLDSAFSAKIYGYSVYSVALARVPVLNELGDPELEDGASLLIAPSPYEHPFFCHIGQRTKTQVTIQKHRAYFAVNPELIMKNPIPATKDAAISNTDASSASPMDSNVEISYETIRLSEYLWCVEKQVVLYGEKQPDVVEPSTHPEEAGKMRNFPPVDANGFYMYYHAPSISDTVLGFSPTTGKYPKLRVIE